MDVSSKYTLIFNSHDLTRSKYDEIYDQAVEIMDFKNSISREVHGDLLQFIGMSKFNFFTYMTLKHKGEMSSNFYYQIYKEVYTCYENKFDKIIDKISFKKITYNGIKRYKKNTKHKKKKGDFKSFDVTTSNTILTTCLTFLARYGGAEASTIKYIYDKLTSPSITDKLYFYYADILGVINKHGYDRLYELALMKRTNVIKRFNKKPIEFTKLTFGGRCRKAKIVDFNKNYNSCINAFVTLSWVNDEKTLEIPVKYSKDYHGNMKSFLKKAPDYEYTITLNKKTKQVNVNICKDGMREIPDHKTNFVGIDVNVKHNLFSLSNNKTYDYDRKLVDEYVQLCRDIDSRKAKNSDYKIGKRAQLKCDKLSEKILKYNQELISTMCKELKAHGFDHIVMENLDNSFGKSFIIGDSINFNRIVNFLHLSSLKDEVEHIARKYGISVSLVHPEYTSKMCPECGCIDDGNRKTQEVFCCVECDHTDNADHNSGINIVNRVTSTVLRKRLLKETVFNTFVPIKISRNELKEVLITCRYTTEE